MSTQERALEDIESLKIRDFALIESSFNNDLEYAQYLLDNYDFTTIDPTINRNGLNKALFEAVTVDMARLLIEYGADDIDGSLLHNVEYTENLDLIEFYLDVGVREETVEEAMEYINNLDLVKLLLEYGADPVDTAKRSVYVRDLDIVDFILQNYHLNDSDFDEVIELLKRERRDEDVINRFIERREVEKEISNEDSLLFNLPEPILEGLMDNLRL